MKTIFKTTLLFLSCIILTALGFTILNADSTTTIGLDINTGDITSTGTITSQDLTIQKSDDTTLTIYSNTDDPTENDKLLIIQKGTTPLELFSVDEDGDVVIANDLSVTGNVTLGTWQGSVVGTQYGGTGSDWSTITQGNLPYFSGTGTLSNLAPGTTGQFLSQGSDGNPAWNSVARSATFMVATSATVNGSSILSKQQADYVCSGTADDVEIQAAIDAASLLEGGMVVIMEGEYDITNEILLKSNINLEGMGGSTILKQGNTTNLDAVILIDTKDNVRVSNILVNGNKDNQSELPSDINFGIKIANASNNITIDHCYVKNAKNLGITVFDGASDSYSKHITISNNVCWDNARDGIALDDWHRYINVSNNTCYDNGDFGVGVARTVRYCNIKNNIVHDNGYGIYAGGVSNFNVSGNLIHHNVNAGIVFDTGGDNNQICNNRIIENNRGIRLGIGVIAGAHSEIDIFGNHISCLRHGIEIDNGCSNIHIIGNRIVANMNNESWDGIVITDGSYINVTSNVIHGSAAAMIDYCVNEIAPSDHNVIKDNILYHHANGIGVTGANTTVRSNQGYTTENSGSVSVSNGDTIAHGLASTPTYINLTTSNASHIVSATSVDGTNITIGLKDNADADITIDETVYWEAEVR